MTNRRLNIDLSGLWENPENLFTIRFKDISERYKKTLTTRIKLKAHHSKIKDRNGPTEEEIYNVLEEINPIIFSENTITSNSYHNAPPFGRTQCRMLGGYIFQTLSRAIYLLTCVKREKTKAEIINIAFLTYADWSKVSIYVNQRFQQIAEREERVSQPPEEIGIEEMARIRRPIEERQYNENQTRQEERQSTEEYEMPETINENSQFQRGAEPRMISITYQRPPPITQRDTIENLFRQYT